MNKIDSSSLVDYYNLVNKYASSDEAKKFVLDLCEGSLLLDAEALNFAISGVIESHSSNIYDEKISTIGDLKSSGNYGDFIGFIDDPDLSFYVVGDLHDDMQSFDQIIKSIDFSNNFENIRLIFLGDYIDRGKDRLSLINKIISLKYFLPNTIYLLKGNHELYRVDEDGNYFSPMLNANPNSHHFDLLTFLINSEKPQHKAYVKQNGIDKALIKLYAKLFDSMPSVALFNFKNLKICAMHGGLPRPNLNRDSFYAGDEFNAFNTLLSDSSIDTVGVLQKKNILWSDPYDGIDEAFRDSSEVRFWYSKDQFISFCEKYDIDLILRAHESQNDGYKTYFNNRLISIFSSGGRNCGEDSVSNENSFYEKVSPNIIKIAHSILSLNINFTKDPIISLEAEFHSDQITNSRYYHEHRFHTSFKGGKKIDYTLIDRLKDSEDVIEIIDLHMPDNRKILIPKASETYYRHSDLSQFFGVHKHTCFVLNHETRTITNISDIKIYIREDDISLSAGESTKVRSRFNLQIGEGAQLGFLI